MLRVLDLDPARAAASTIWALAVLRDQTLKPHHAGVAEQVGADLTLLVRGGMDAIGAAREELGEVLRSDSGSRR
jgi:hypothetical protein